MSIDVSCPNCYRGYTLADNLQGKKIRCKTCQTPFVVEPDDEIEDYGEESLPAVPVSAELPASTELPAESSSQRKSKKRKPRRRAPARSPERSTMPSILPKIFGLTFWLFLVAIGVFAFAMYSRIGGAVALAYGFVVVVLRRQGLADGEISIMGFLLLKFTSLMLMTAGWFSVTGRLENIQYRDPHQAMLERNSQQLNSMMDDVHRQMDAQQQHLDQIGQMHRRISRDIDDSMRRRNPFPERTSRSGTYPGQIQSSTGTTNERPTGPPPDPDYFSQVPLGYEVVPEKMEIPDGTPILVNDGRNWYRAVTTKEVGNIRLKLYVKQDAARREIIRLRSELQIHASHLAALMGDDYAINLESYLPPEERFKIFAPSESSYTRIPEEFTEPPQDEDLPPGTPVLARWDNTWYPAEIEAPKSDKLQIRFTFQRYRTEEMQRADVRVHSGLLAHLGGGPRIVLPPELVELFETYTAQQSQYSALPRGFQPVAETLKLVPETPLLAQSGTAWYPVTVVADEGPKIKIRWDRYASKPDEPLDRSSLRIHEKLLEPVAAVAELIPEKKAADPPAEPPGDGNPQAAAPAEDSAPPQEVNAEFLAKHAQITTAQKSFRELPAQFLRVTSEVQLPAGTPLLAFWGSGWYPIQVLEDRGTQVKVHWVNYGKNFDEPLDRDKLRIHKDLLKALATR